MSATAAVLSRGDRHVYCRFVWRHWVERSLLLSTVAFFLRIEVKNPCLQTSWMTTSSTKRVFLLAMGVIMTLKMTSTQPITLETHALFVVPSDTHLSQLSALRTPPVLAPGTAIKIPCHQSQKLGLTILDGATAGTALWCLPIKSVCAAKKLVPYSTGSALVVSLRTQASLAFA